MSLAPQPASERNGRLDAATVAAAALAVANRGELISATSVQRELGRGSMTTVAKHVKAWASQNMPVLAGKVSAPRWTVRETEAMAALRRIFREEAAQSLAEERIRAKEEGELARQQVATAQEQVRLADNLRERADERAKGLEAGMAGLNEQLAAAAKDREAQAAQIERLQATQTEAARQYEQTVNDLRKQVEDAVVRYAGMERHMLIEIDRARTDRDKAKTRFDDDLRLVEARLVRAQIDLDRVRSEREAADNRATKAEAELQQSTAARGDAERRLSVAEGQVATLVDKTGALAESQHQLATQLAAAQQEAAAVEKARERLQHALEALLRAVPATAEFPNKEGLARLIATASAAQRALHEPAR